MEGLCVLYDAPHDFCATHDPSQLVCLPATARNSVTQPPAPTLAPVYLTRMNSCSCLTCRSMGNFTLPRSTGLVPGRRTPRLPRMGEAHLAAPGSRHTLPPSQCCCHFPATCCVWHDTVPELPETQEQPSQRPLHTQLHSLPVSDTLLFLRQVWNCNWEW